MNLDASDKQKMGKAYHAYLENTPGSKKALQELLGELKSNTSTENAMPKSLNVTKTDTEGDD